MCPTCRLDLLRKMVPHTERTNTACFLEEVLKYIDALKTRVVELESTLHAVRSGKAMPVSLGAPPSRGGQKPDAAAHERMVALQQQQPGAGQQQHNLLNVGYSLQHLQQQQLQQQQQHQQQQQLQLQLQHEAALAALCEEQQQQTAAVFAVQQLRQVQQHDVVAPRQQQLVHLADLAGQLGMRPADVDREQQGNGGYAAAPNGIDAAAAAYITGGGWQHAVPSPQSQQTLHLPPVPQLHMPVLAAISAAPATSDDAPTAVTEAATAAAASAAEIGAAAAAASSAADPEGAPAPSAHQDDTTRDDSKTSSPATSEEGGVPIKKRKVLLL